MADQDREITLNTGKLLGVFFGVVIICAFFFVAGFTMGKNSAPAAPSSDTLPAPVPAATAAKPPSAKASGVKDCSTTPEGCPPVGSNELAFSKPADSANPAPGTVSAAPAPTAPPNPAAAAPEMPKPPAQTTYMVQVAAVSKQQDAEALASALRRKNYAVTVTTPISDNLFRVQVGPFAELREAEAMRTRLLSDGYNPIVKR